MPKVKFLGVYSTKHRNEQQRTSSKEFFFVWQIKDEGETYIHVQEIDGTYTPKGKVFAIDKSTLNFFVFEPSILAVPLTKTEEVLKVLKPKEAPREEATREEQILEEAAESAQAMIEAVMRHDFDKAMKELDDPNARNLALRHIKNIVDKPDIVPGHKHMMRDFTIALRKKKLAEVAQVFAEKTVALAPNDDHAHFNLARIYEILGKYRDAREQLSIALSLPHNEQEDRMYRKMMNHVASEERLRNPFGRR